MSDLTLRALQRHIRQNDYQPEALLRYLQKLMEEVGELARAMQEGTLYRDSGDIKGTIDEELYDVLYYVAAIANLYDIDLESAVRLKETVNARKYGRPLYEF